MNSINACCPRALKAVMNTLLGNKRAFCQPPVKWQHKQQAYRAFSVVAKEAPRAEKEEERTVGEHIDLLLQRVDKRWSLIQEPQHMRGVLQTLRRCKILSRLLPRGLMLRFVIATDEENGASWVLPDPAGSYPGRGMHVVPTHSTLAQLGITIMLKTLSKKKDVTGLLRNAFKRKTLLLPPVIADYVEAQLLRHTQQVVLEACLQASSARMLEEDHPALKNVQQRKAEVSCIPEPAGPSANFSFEMLDLAVSDSLDTHIRRMNEIDTNEAKSTTWIIQPQTQLSSVLQLTATSEFPANVSAEGGLSRVLHVLTREEFREALQYSGSDEPSAAIGTIMRHVLDVKANKYPVLVVDGVCNAASNRLHQAQLRLHIYRQSKHREQR